MADTSIPQGFSIFQPALGAHLEFFPAVGTQELDDMINAYIPGPASIQEKRATVAVDFLEYAQVTGQTFKFYAVYPVASFIQQSPVSDSASSFNASPATSSYDWSQASRSSSHSSVNGRQPRNPSPGTVSRHQTADFSHLPGMKIMTKDGQDVTNTASRGSKTKEQRDHAHLMRIIKACDSCKRKKIRCDPSHKKRGADKPAQSSKVAKKTKVSTPPRQQQPMASSSALGGDAFLAQASIDWNPSFTFADLEVPEFAMPFEPVEDLSEQANLTPEDYEFLFNNTKDFFSQPFESVTPYTSPGEGSASSQSSVPGPVWASAGGSVDSYSDFALYSPSSSFSEDDNMVSIEASSERFSTKSVSQSPAEQSQSQSQSPTDLSEGPSYSSIQPQDSSIQPHDDPWYNDGIDWSVTQEPSATGASDEGIQRGAVFARDLVDEFYDAEWLCDPNAENATRAPGLLPVRDRGVGNGDLMAAFESAVSTDGIAHTRRRGQTVNHSSTTSCGRSSTDSETEPILRSSLRPDHADAVAHDSVSATERQSLTAIPRLPDGLAPPGDVIPRGERVSAVAMNATEAHVQRRERLAVQSSAAATTTTDVQRRERLAVQSSAAATTTTDVQHERLAVQSGAAATTATDVQHERPAVQSTRVVAPRTVAAQSAILATWPGTQNVEQVKTQGTAAGVAEETVQHLDHVGIQRNAVAISEIPVQHIDHGYVSGTAVAATECVIQRLASGIRKPIVDSIPPLSSQAVLFVMSLAVVAVMLRSVAPASVMLSISAVVLRMSTMPGLLTSQLGSCPKRQTSSSASRGTYFPASDRCRSSARRSGYSYVPTDMSLARLLAV